MKKNNIIWAYQLVIITAIFLVSNSCQKDDSISNLITGKIKFNPDLTYETVSDIDGNTYKTITIGTQTWIAENLRVTHYRNGDLIETTSPADLDLSSQSTPKYQWAYDGKEKNVAIYGRLYTWNAVTDSRNICPTGWHVPTTEEWETLINYLGGEEVAGGKLKETGISHWKGENGLVSLENCLNYGATNESGFTAVPGGTRWGISLSWVPAQFLDIVETGYWWIKTDYYDDYYKWSRCIELDYDEASISLSFQDYRDGLSVRCVKD